MQSPKSYFMDVKCLRCYKITTIFTSTEKVVLCVVCSTILYQPTEGKARLTKRYSEIAITLKVPWIMLKGKLFQQTNFGHTQKLIPSWSGEIVQQIWWLECSQKLDPWNPLKSPKALPKVIPELRVRSKPWVWPGMTTTTKKTKNFNSISCHNNKKSYY